MRKHILIALIAFSLLIPLMSAETETPVGIFSVANVAPPTSTGWTPITTHDKIQAFSWTEGTDDNGDPISTYICISADTDDDSCDVINSGLTATPSYTFTQAEPNWDYAPFMTGSRNYYVKLTSNDGTENGTANTTMSFTLIDAVPYLTAVSSPTGGSICDIDWDEITSLTFDGTTADSDSDDTSFRVCSTNSFSTTEDACNGGVTACSTSQNATASKSCTNTGLTDPATGAVQTSYAFTCDCAENDAACPSQCNTTGQAITYYVNQQPADIADAALSGGTTGDTDLTCTGTTASYGTGDTGDAGTGQTNFDWTGGTGDNCGGSSTGTCAEANFYACQTITCITEAEDDCNRLSANNDSAQYIINNTIPSMSAWIIQNGASNFADMAANASTTHDNTPKFRITISDADLEDSAPQQATVRINISASTPGAVDAGGPYTTTVTASGDVDVDATTELVYDGASKTYYVSIEVYDNATCDSNAGTTKHLTFSLTNNLAYINVLNITETHDTTPTVSWTITDADDGTDGKWPADDEWNSHLWVIDAEDGTIYCDYEGTAIQNGQTLCELPWGTPGTAWANRTINSTVWIEDKFAANAGYHEQGTSAANTTKQFTLYDYLPDVTDISMTDAGSAYSSCTSASCALNPIEHSNATVAVKITATDTDDDCDGNSAAYVHLCRVTGATACDETNNAHYSWQIDSVSRSGSTCTYVFSANKTASDSTPEFFRLPNTGYKLHVNVTSQAGERTSDAERDANWTYGTLKAIEYPSTITLGDGDPTLGQWNDGTVVSTMINWGNDNLNIQLSSTDPTSGSDTWVLNNTDMKIDDDNSYTTEAGPIAPVYLNGTAKTFEPATGLEVCSSAACSDAGLNDTLDTYYHIAPPLGLLAGTYNSTITITIS